MAELFDIIAFLGLTGHSYADESCMCRLPAHSVHSRQQLRSTASGTLLVPRTRTATGQRSFAVNGPRTWNIMPAKLRTPNMTLCYFKRHLKAHPFQQ